MDIRILPFLMAVGIFVACTGILYASYQDTANDYQNKLTDLEMTSKYGPYWAVQNIRGSSVTVPVNDAVAFEDMYGSANYSYRRGMNFIWDATDTYFYIEATWTEGYHNDKQVGLLIMTWSPAENAWVSASWLSMDLPDVGSTDTTPVQVGKDWFLERNVTAYLTMLPAGFLGIVSGGILMPAAITYATIIRTQGAFRYGNDNRYIQGVWPYNCQLNVSYMTLAQSNVASNDNGLVKGYVTITWGTYAGTMAESVSNLVGKITGTIRGAFAGLFGAVFGDYGRQFVDTLSSVLTMDVPGMPTAVRAMLAIPLNLALIFIIATFMAMFIPFLGGG